MNGAAALAVVEHYAKPRNGSGVPKSDPAYKSYFPEMVFQLRLLGATNRNIAAACNVTETTIWNWAYNPAKLIPEFAQAMEDGGQLADARMAQSTFHRGVGYSHEDEKIVVVDKSVVRVPIIKHYPPDTSAAIFWLTNRQRQLWRNRTSTELTGEDGQPLVPPQLVIQPVTNKE